MDEKVKDLETKVKINIFMFREHGYNMIVLDNKTINDRIKDLWCKISKQG